MSLRYAGAMTRALLLSLFAVACSSATPPVRYAEPPTRVDAVADFELGGVGRCGAGLVGPDLLVTAAHCVHGNRHRFRVGDESMSRGIDLIAANEVDDVAWFRVRRPVDTWLARRQMRRGEPVFAVVRRDGAWRALVETSGEPGHFSKSTLILHGDSGSPVVGADGALLGIVVTCFRRLDSKVCTGGGRWRPL